MNDIRVSRGVGALASLVLQVGSYCGIVYWYGWTLGILTLLFNWGVRLQTRLETSDSIERSLLAFFSSLAGKQGEETTTKEGE